MEVVHRIPEEGYASRKIYLFPTSLLDAESLQVGKPDQTCGEAMVNAIRVATGYVMEGGLRCDHDVPDQ